MEPIRHARGSRGTGRSRGTTLHAATRAGMFGTADLTLVVVPGPAGPAR